MHHDRSDYRGPVCRCAGAFLGLGLAFGASLSAGAESSHASGNFEPHHVLGVFLGDTTTDRSEGRNDRREGFTLGVEYEYRATERFGIGAIAEHVAGDFDTNVFVLPLALHVGSWKWYAGPGIERASEGEELLLRVGAEYGFHVGDFEISPQVDLDFVDGDRLFVIGLTFARPF